MPNEESKSDQSKPSDSTTPSAQPDQSASQTQSDSDQAKPDETVKPPSYTIFSESYDPKAAREAENDTSKEDE